MLSRENVPLMSPLMPINWWQSVQGSLVDPRLISLSLVAVSFINQGFKEINALIERYNQTDDLTIKRQLIREMDAQKQRLQDHARGDVLTALSEYDAQLLNGLSNQLHEQTKYLNRLQPLPFQEHESSPAMVLNNMSQSKVVQLLTLLSAGGRNLHQLNELYTVFDDSIDFGEADDFNTLLSTHGIRCLSAGNAQNFLLEDTADIDKRFVHEFRT